MSLFGRLFGGDGDATAHPKIGLEAVQTVLLPDSVAESTQAHLRAAGRAGNEGLVVWSGVQDGGTFRVRTVTFPEQRPIRRGGGVGVVIEGVALHNLNVWLHEHGERPLAQVHSHPTGAYHSDTDDDFAVVTSAGGLSIVVPDFAARPFSMSENAAYRLTASGAWVEIAPQAARALIVKLSGS